MSYRMSSDSTTVDRVVVLGAAETSQRAADRCADVLELPSQLVGAPAFLEFDERVGEEDRLLALPLVGLLGQQILGVQTLNFASPRRPADRGATRRQRALVAVFGLIVVAGAGYLFAQSSLSALEHQRSRLRGQYNETLEAYMEALRLEARVEHAEHFTDADADWISHLAWISESMPDTHDALANQFRATSIPEVTFTPRVTEVDGSRYVSYTGGRWSHAQTVNIFIDGQVRSRQIADQLRDRWLASGVYTVDTRGPDDPRAFSFDLITTEAAPTSSQMEEAP